MLKFPSRAWPRTRLRSWKGSSIFSRLRIGGMKPLLMVRSAETAFTTPAPPARCPCIDFMAVIGILRRISSPRAVRRVVASARSPDLVEVA